MINLLLCSRGLSTLLKEVTLMSLTSSLEHNMKKFKCVKLAWSLSLGFDLFRVRRVARAGVRIGVGLG